MKLATAVGRMALLLAMLWGASAVGLTQEGGTSLVAAGELGDDVWVEIRADGAAADFRIVAEASGGCSLSFPGLKGVAGQTLEPGLRHLPALSLTPSPDGGMSLRLPFHVADLREVVRDGAIWRFTFGAASASALGEVDGEYRLGVRDVIEVAVYGHEDLTRIDAVPAGGVLSVPLIGEVQVEGRTTAEIEEEIERRLGANYLVDPQVNVRVRDYESQWVNVIGMVRTPGKYPIKGRTSLIDMITQAGGLTEKAGDRVVVTRPVEGGRTRQFAVERDDLFSVDNESANVLLRHGDVVNVAEQSVFYIQGEVSRPGSYPLQSGYTLLKAISIAGGVSQWADRKGVELLREVDGEQETIVLNLKAIEQRKQPDLELLPEDIIIVKRRLL